MNAMVLSAPRPVESTPLQRQEMAIPEPQAGEILVRVRCCGVCHTDLHIVEGEMPPARLPLVPGHQVVAVVERLGPGLTHPAPGSRVGAAWLYASCGACAACRRGDENLCERITFTGYHVNGGYAEYMLARADYVDALRRVRRGGVVVINAVHLDQIPAFDYGLLYWERVLRSVSNSTRQDGLEFLQLAASIPLTVQVQPYPLTEANAALASLKHGGITGAAVLVVP